MRTRAEIAAFKAALGSMGVWYAHRLATTYILSELPEGWPKTEAARPFFPQDWLRGKGWPTFERSVSGLVKRSTLQSWRRIVDPAVPRGFFGGYCEPPMHPRAFARSLALKIFSNGADCEVVARLYAATLDGALGNATALEFSEVGWGDDEAVTFAEVLPLLRSLETLNISRNNIGGRGYGALAAAIRAGAAPRLKKILHGGERRPTVSSSSAEELSAWKDAYPQFLEVCIARRIVQQDVFVSNSK